MAAQVFVSYAREDQPRIHLLVSELEQRGWSVFWDRRIPAGQDWRSHIGRALGEARCVVVAWSQAAVASRYIAEEAEEALRQGILVPVRLDAVEPPFGFREINAADLTGWQPGRYSEEFEQFVEDVSAVIAQRTATSRPASAAIARSTGRGLPGRPRRYLYLGIGGAAVLGSLLSYNWYHAASITPPVPMPSPSGPLSAGDALRSYSYELGWSGAPLGTPDTQASRSTVTGVSFGANSLVTLEYARPGIVRATVGARSLTGTWQDKDGSGDIELLFNADYSRAEGWWNYGGLTKKYNAFMRRTD